MDKRDIWGMEEGSGSMLTEGEQENNSANRKKEKKGHLEKKKKLDFGFLWSPAKKTKEFSHRKQQTSFARFVYMFPTTTHQSLA